MLDIPPENIALQEPPRSRAACSCSTPRPGRIIDDAEIKGELASTQAVRQVAQREHGAAGRAAGAGRTTASDGPGHDSLLRQRAFGYTQEDIDIMLEPMATTGEEADRLDGQRHAAGGAVRPAAAAVQLLPPAVRAGHQPAARPAPRRNSSRRWRPSSAPRATCSTRRRSTPASSSSSSLLTNARAGQASSDLNVTTACARRRCRPLFDVDSGGRGRCARRWTSCATRRRGCGACAATA